MRICCSIQSCKYWKKSKDAYLDDVGECGLEEINVSITASANYALTCQDYEERKGANECT